MVWITSMVAAGGSFAPAYQWLATLDIDYGGPLGRWQQFLVVLSTQLFGWSLGHMLRHIFVGRRNGIIWPDTLPLSFLIQSLYSERGESGNGIQITDNSSAITINTEFEEDQASDAKTEIYDAAQCGRVMGEQSSESDFGCPTTSTRHLALLTGGTFVYQVVISYIAPVFKSLCLLCIWAPQNKLLSLLGSGWNGTGILSLTFDWEALGTLQPLITPLWAQIQYYAGAILMTYVLTPIGWRLNWWGSQSLPIVSTNVFDTSGNAYNISLVHRFRNPDADISEVDSDGHYSPGALMYKTYSPVRLTVNSALGYICSVAAITAVIVHLALWHPQWLRQAAIDMANALVRLWDPRPLFRTRESARIQNESQQQGEECIDQQRTTEGDAANDPQKQMVTWNIGYAIGRIGRVLTFTLTLGVAILSPQLGITALPGWQALLAVIWSMLMCLPIGFVEAVTGFTLPMDLLPHMFGGLMQGPGTPIETSYFHLWATVPIRVALGWSGVRSFQLAHHCCPQQQQQQEEGTGGGAGPSEQRRKRRLHCNGNGTSGGLALLPWLKRGLFIGIVWGACVNQLSYMVFSRSLDAGHVLPVEEPPALPEELANLAPVLLPDSMSSLDMDSLQSVDLVDDQIDSEADEPPIANPLGWHEPGEFGRLPAALSSELVVWGIVGPQSIFAGSSPYRMLFVYGALTGTLLPPLLHIIHLLFARMARPSGDDRERKRSWLRRIMASAAMITRAVQIPLVLTGMVAVPTIPANFAITGLAAAVVGRLLIRWRRKTLMDLSLYSAGLYMGTRLAIVGMFAMGEILSINRMSLVFVNWWGNQLDNVEHCADI
ncbi:hypothetical protein H4R20_002092 [Coemansia guatemalensis]|uniref:OPT superfamily oligopeptide transporter n=1 Tax=Coemansia guatemalensis TaxID=2761395 RepID=A0A9W8HYA4_9FUNG|nr:hypothetical protein H4R20_002092 [Coemansia guatemalensis]